MTKLSQQLVADSRFTSGAPTHGRASFFLFFFRNYWLQYIEFYIELLGIRYIFDENIHLKYEQEKHTSEMVEVHWALFLIYSWQFGNL